MPDRVIERKAAQYQNTSPDVAALLRQANALVPQKSRRDRRSPSLEARDQYREAIRAFQQGPATKDTITRLWQTRYNVLGSRVGLRFEIPDLDYFQGEIDGLAHMQPARKLIYVPDQLGKTPEGLVVLSRMYRKMRAWVDRPDAALLRVTHGSNEGGWFHIESDWQTPFTNTTQEGLRGELNRLAQVYPHYIWRGGRLSTYIIGSQDSKDLTGHYYDESSWVRLLESFYDGEILCAFFDPGGERYFLWGWLPRDQCSVLGGRFEGAKP